MAGLLDALFANESGRRNIANTTQGTSSGQAQGYFQITTGTWKEFAQKAGIDTNKYPTPMTAADGTPVPYSVQAQVASVIPLKRWDPSTLAKMSATGKPVDPNRTLGENLVAAGENIQGAPRVSGPLEAAGGGGGSDVGAPQLYTPPVAAGVPPAANLSPPSPLSAAADIATLQKNDPWSSLASGLAASVSDKGSNPAASALPELPVPNLDAPTAIPAAAPAPDLGSPDTGSLADLFKVGDFGQAAALNVDRMGQPVRRRQYG